MNCTFQGHFCFYINSCQELFSPFGTHWIGCRQVTLKEKKPSKSLFFSTSAVVLGVCFSFHPVFMVFFSKVRMANRKNTMLCLLLVYLGLSKGERNPHRQWHINAQRKDKARNSRKRGEYIFLKSQSCVIVAAHFFLHICRAPLATHTKRDSLAAFSLWPIAVMSPQTKPQSSSSRSKILSFPLLPAGYFLNLQ